MEVASLESMAMSSLAKTTFHLAYSLLAPAAFGGFEWILRALFSMVSATTSVNFGAPFFVNIYRYQLELAYLLALPFLLLGVLVSVYERSLTALMQGVLVKLPLAVLVSESGLTLVSWLNHLVDAISLPLISHGGLAAGMITSASGLVHSRTVPAIAALLILVLGCIAALCVWIELSIRAGLLYLISAVLPLACVGMLFPHGRTWLRRTAEVLVAVIVCKYFIFLTLALGIGAVSESQGVAGDSTQGTFLAGVALMMVASFSPYLVLRLLPVAEAHLAGALEGASQHVTRRLGRAAMAGRSFLGSEGVEAVGADLSRLSPKNSLPPYVGYEPSWEYLNDQSKSMGAWEIYGDYLESRGFVPPPGTSNENETQASPRGERVNDL